jgi:hypothetical protein
MARGMFRQENLAPDTGGSFKEGNLKVIKAAVFRNHHPDVRPGQKDRGTVVAIALECNRLDEDLDPILDQDEEPVKETIILGLGNGSLKDVHPGVAGSLEEALSEDGEGIEDQGTEDGEEGNTLFLVNKEWKLHPKTAAGIFFASLQKGREKEKEKGQFLFKGCQLPPEKVDALFYGPSWKGYVFHIKNWVDPDNTIKDEQGKDRTISYKVVEKVLKSPGKGGKEEEKGEKEEKPAKTGKKKLADDGDEAPAAAAPKKEAKEGTNGNKQVEGVVATILTKLSETNDGETITMKQFRTQAKEQLDKMGAKVDESLHVDIISTYKDIEWLVKHAEKYDMTVSEDRASVTFAT